MTKYILHGGRTSKSSEDNNNFFLEMTKVDKKQVKILCVYFACEEKVWDKLFDQDKGCFSSAAPTKTLSFTRAVNNPDIFIDQINEADVVYIRGGVTDNLMSALQPYNNLGQLLTNKLVSGSSAGACVLSQYYHTGTANTRAKAGLGILPIKTFVHYSEDKHAALEELKNLGQQLPIYKIPEGKFVVVEH